MLAYLKNETDFIRAYGNRGLLLIFLCALTRTGSNIPHASALGLTIDLNPGVIAIIGSVLSLLILISLKLESDTLMTSREAILDEFSELHASSKKIKRLVYALFVVPALCAAFFFLQYVLKVARIDAAGGCSYKWQQHFIDWSGSAGASIYCIGNKTEGMPWIYPPWQTYFYIIIVILCGLLSYQICASWQKYRG